MDFPTLSLAQATEFRDHVVAREPYLLRELAQWMVATGGPVDQMDASLASLVPLWEWYVELARADFRGLTDGLTPSTDPELLMPSDEASRERIRQSLVGGDRLVHYLRLAVTRLHPDTSWQVYRGPLGARERDHHQTELVLRGRKDPHRPKGQDWGVQLHWALPASNGVIRLNNYDSGQLHRMLVLRLPKDLGRMKQKPLGSVLTPYLDADLPPIPEIARISPWAWWQQAQAAPAPDPVVREVGDWSDMILAKGPGDGLDDPGLLAPLPADRVAEALRDGGFEDLSVADLLSGEEFLHADGVAQLMTLTHKRHLRAIHLQPIDPTIESWEHLIAPLRMLAVDLGANLVPEGDYPD
ncbi:hypothetical protein [Cellulomonas sp. P5_C5]